MNDPIGNLLFAIAFFTRIPVGHGLSQENASQRSLVDCVSFFPIAGLLVGVIVGAVWMAASLLFPATVSAGLAIASGILLTGALHEDGFADCADGLGGTSDRSRALEIMRDSRIGTYGSIALVFSITLRWMALASMPVSYGFAALIIAHTVSRSSIVTALYTSQYARPQGLGSMAEGEISLTDLIVTFGLTAVLCLVFGGLDGISAGICGLVAGWLFLQYLKYRLGGYTGDGLGAIEQISEISILMLLAGFWS